MCRSERVLGAGLDTEPERERPGSATAPPWASSSLLASAGQHPCEEVIVHAQLEGLVYPTLKSMKVESREFFNAHISTTSATLAESYLTVSGMSRCNTFEWLLSVGAALKACGSDCFDQQLLFKALSYLDGFYGSAARSSALKGAGQAQERAFAACLLAWKMKEKTVAPVSHVTGIMAKKMKVRINIPVVLRLEKELAFALDFKLSAPSVSELVEAVDIYLRLLDSAACADVTKQIAHALVTDEDIAGSVEPVSIVLLAAVLAQQICDTSAATSAYVVQEVCKMFDEPSDPESILRLRQACKGKLRSMLELSRHGAAGTAPGRLLATLRQNVAAKVAAAFKNARVQQPQLTGAIKAQVSSSQPAPSSPSSVEAQAQPLDGR
eukprot:TRINITY_DN14105_c0_g1_i5.p1 TRINITY_DN14105_c0_g1~~TRINITY_DN14105_c0_g1_i5.p1  ORF type:complete len:381 (+),score=90.52 TRINITY_DN14105_c0_g1_i5:76-1218(+)